MARKPVKVDDGRPIDVSVRLRMPYGRLLVPEAEGGYRGEILEFPGCIAEGDDAPEALSELEAAAEGWIEAAMEMGTPIPPPLEETNFSGRLNLRLPKSLHRKAALAAELDGVSLNQFIVASIAEYMGQRSAEHRRATKVFYSVHGGDVGWIAQSTTLGTGPRMLSGVQPVGSMVTTFQDFQYADR